MTRREFARTLVSASAGAILPGWMSASSGPTNIKYDFGPVRQRILEAVANGKATGVAVAALRDGRILWEEGFGWANHEAGLKVRVHTPFSLASITKPFTTTALMTLVAEGKLSLDDAANKYLRKSKIVGPNGNPDGATIRRLGAHAGGLPSMFEHFFRDGSAQAPNAEMLLSKYGRLAYLPGSCYEYSNIGYSALGTVASNVTGIDFGSLMTRRVLGPLGLRDCFFGTNAARLETSAVRYDGSGNPIPYYITSTPPSGELYASARDLACFAMFNLKSDLRSQSRILDPRWIDELHKPVFQGPSGAATTFGWFSATTKSGIHTVFKGGGQPGVATILYMVPSKSLACLALTNRSDGRELAFGICDQILAMILPEWTEPDETVAPPPSSFIATPGFVGRWEGQLTDGGANMRAKLEIQLRARLPSLMLIQKGADTRKEEKHGRAEMCHPASGKQRQVCLGQILWFIGNIGEEVPRVVKRHPHHDQPTEDIYRRQSNQQGTVRRRCDRRRFGERGIVHSLGP